MKEVLIHIGLHKTGTTWLQNELFISANNIFEPLSPSGKVVGHSSLAKNFVFDRNNNLLNSFDDNYDDIKKSLELIMKEKKDINKIFVLSHERLSGYPHCSAFDSSIILKRLYNIFPSAKILIVIREQVSGILSNYFEYLDEDGTLNLTKYINEKYDGRKPGFSDNYYEYHYLINSYQKKFGKENVLVLPFELFSTNKNIFLEKLGVFVNKEIIVNDERINIKYNVKQNHILNYKLRFLNNYIHSSSSLNRMAELRFYFLKVFSLKLKQVLKRLIKKNRDDILKEKLRRDIRSWSKSRFAKSNKITEELTGLNLKELGYIT